MNFGLIQSKIDGTEYQFKAPQSLDMPIEYSYQHHLPKVLNQGSMPICVPCSISSYINWREGSKIGESLDTNVQLKEIYNIRANKHIDGMSFKEALHYLRHHGVNTDYGTFKINRYAMVGSIVQLKMALLMNGPCIAGLPCYEKSMTSEFWIPNGAFLGGHAITIVGFNKDGFIIRNSWGEAYGHQGYILLNYKDFDKFMEIWTIM